MDLVPSFRSVAEVAANTTPYNFVADANNSSDTLFIGYSPILLNFASAMCIIFILIGVPGNLITIIALARCKKVRNATAVFIINLSLSDLLFCCFNLPLAASTFWHRAWVHGDLLCRLFPLLRYGLLAVSLFTVLSITINRYVMIGHPRIYPRVYRHKFLGIMVATCWLFAFGALIPTWNGLWGEFGLDHKIGSCTILRDGNDNSPKQFLFIMAFALPCLCIIVCYARIFYIVRKTAMRTHELKPAASVKMTHNPTTSVPKASNNCQASNHSLNSTVAVTVEVRRPDDDPKPVENGHKLKENRLSFYDERMHELLGNDGEGQPILADESDAHKRRRQMFVSKSYRYNNDGDGADLRFIDMSVDSDAPPPSRKISNNNRYSEEVVAGLQADGTPYFIEPNGTPYKQRSEHDSAVDESISSSENQQTYHPQSPPTEPVVDPIVQLEPSSSSGIELPYDHDHDTPAKTHKYEKKSIVSAIRQSTRRIRKHRSNGTSIAQNRSHANTSGASIMYPGRLSTKDRRLLKMILVIFISFLICYLPITLTKLLHDITEVHGVNIAGYLLIYLTTCINPIIYVIMSSEYRQAYKNLMCRTNGRAVETGGEHKRQGTVKS